MSHKRGPILEVLELVGGPKDCRRGRAGWRTGVSESEPDSVIEEESSERESSDSSQWFFI